MAVVRRSRRFAFLFAGGVGAVVGLVVAAGFVALSRLPGGREQVRWRRVLTAGEVGYVLPNDYLQSRLAEGFPRTFPVTENMEVQLDRPLIEADADRSFLRYEVDFAVRAASPGTQPLPAGRATLRTQLKFDRATGAIALTQVELVKVTGLEGDRMATMLLPALFKGVVAPALEGQVIYLLPADGGFWQRTGVKRVRDVRIEDGAIEVVVGW